jgi:hypothetical protein
MPHSAVPIQNPKGANALYARRQRQSSITQSFHPTENPYEERTPLTSSDIVNIVLALTRKALVVFEFAGQGASPTTAPRTSALLPKQYLSDMLPKAVGS